MPASRTAYDRFVSQEANFVFELPSGRYRIYEYSDQGDLSLADAAGSRIDLDFFPGAGSEDDLAQRFAQRRVRCRADGLNEIAAPAAIPMNGECFGYVQVEVSDARRAGFVAARPWFGGIVVCTALLTKTPPDEVPAMSAVRDAWNWLRRERARS